MPIPNLIYIIFISVYGLLYRIPIIIKKKLKKRTVEEERLRIFGELPLILTLVFYSLTIYLVYFETLNLSLFLIGMVLIVFGAFFNEWARYILGKQWSGGARILKKHKLIKTGPYSVVRHPIYFANIIMMFGSLLIVWSYLLFFIFVVTVGILLYRARIEELVLIKKFGNKYIEYKKKVAMIIPLLF